MHLIVPLLALLVLSSQFQTIGNMENLCPTQHSRKYVDISSAKIEKSSTFEYSLELYDSPATIFRNQSQITFRGNFSKLTLKNHALRKEFTYFGTEMILKIPADHVFSMTKIPDLEIQIVHAASQQSKINSFRFVMLSQLFMVSKFTNKIQTELSKYFHPLSKNGDIIQTSKIVKIIDGFPMLMYKGSAESFPCRSDLLCLLKREYQLMTQEDFQEVRSLLFEDGKLLPKTKAVKRKNLYQIQQIPRKKIENNEDL